MTHPIVIQHLKDIGKIGGKVTSQAKRIAAKANAMKGGRKRKIFIYGLLNLRTGRVEYIGQTCDPKQRATTHKSSCLGSSGGRPRKWNYPVSLVILAVTTESDANKFEHAFWRHYKRHGQCDLLGDRFITCGKRADFMPQCFRCGEEWHIWPMETVNVRCPKCGSKNWTLPKKKK